MKTVEETLALYGYSLELGQIISPIGLKTGVYPTEKKGRLYCRSGMNHLIWSGNSIADFLESYWFAEILEVKE